MSIRIHHINTLIWQGLINVFLRNCHQQWLKFCNLTWICSPIVVVFWKISLILYFNRFEKSSGKTWTKTIICSLQSTKKSNLNLSIIQSLFLGSPFFWPEKKRSKHVTLRKPTVFHCQAAAIRHLQRLHPAPGAEPRAGAAGNFGAAGFGGAEGGEEVPGTEGAGFILKIHKKRYNCCNENPICVLFLYESTQKTSTW